MPQRVLTTVRFVEADLVMVKERRFRVSDAALQGDPLLTYFVNDTLASSVIRYDIEADENVYQYCELWDVFWDDSIGPSYITYIPADPTYGPLPSGPMQGGIEPVLIEYLSESSSGTSLSSGGSTSSASSSSTSSASTSSVSSSSTSSKSSSTTCQLASRFCWIFFSSTSSDK